MTLSQSIMLRDGMSAVLNQISTNLERTISGFEAMQAAAGNQIPTQVYEQMNANIEEMRASLQSAVSQVDSLGQAFQNAHPPANTLLGTVKKLAVTLGGLAAVRGIIGLSDELTQTTARLNLMNDNLQTTEQLQNMIFAANQRSRGSYLQTADTVAKLGLLAKNAFSSNAETIAFVEQLNKHFAIVGTSQEGRAAAMLQLTQAMSSGVLRGEELNSIFDQAPTIIQTIADYLGVTVGEVKELAQEGDITATIVKNALLSAADETNARFNEMPKTFTNMWDYFESYAVKAFQPVLDYFNTFTNSEEFKHFVDNCIGAVVILSEIVIDVFDRMAAGAAWARENWDVLAPIILGVASALLIYHGYLTAVSIAERISGIQKGIAAVMAYAHARGTDAEAAAAARATAAQYGFNAALLTCPITWIVVGIIALISILYAAVAAFNHFTDSSVSATGIVGAAFAVLGAHLYNMFIVPVWNWFASLANFIANVFHNPIAAVKVLFFDMAQTIIGYIRNVAAGIEALINMIPGMQVDITSGLDALYGRIERASKQVKDASGWKEIVQRKDFIDYRIAAQTGYDFGQRVEAKLSDTFNLDKILQDAKNGLDENIYSSIPEPSLGDIADTAENTGKMAKSLEITEEDLKYLKDLAEREVINRFTTAEIRLEMHNNNTISGTNDIDGIVDYLGQRLEEMMVTAAEGVHD